MRKREKKIRPDPLQWKGGKREANDVKNISIERQNWMLMAHELPAKERMKKKQPEKWKEKMYTQWILTKADISWEMIKIEMENDII